MSNTPLGKKSNPDIQFTTGNIGRWAGQQEDPFAEQNRQRAAKKQERNRKRLKTAPIIAIISGSILGVAALIGLVFLIIAITKNPLPEDITPGSEGAIAVSNEAQQVYDDYIKNFYNRQNSSDGDLDGSAENPNSDAVQGAMNAVNDYFTQRENGVRDDAQQNDYKLIQMLFYNSNGQPAEIIKVAEGVKTDLMSNEQKLYYWGMLVNASFNIGDGEKAYYYVNLMEEIMSNEEVQEVRG